MFEPPVEYNVNSYFYKYKEMLMKKDAELLDELIFLVLKDKIQLICILKKELLMNCLHMQKKRILKIFYWKYQQKDF